MAAPGDDKDRIARAAEAKTTLVPEGADTATLPPDSTIAPGAGGAPASLRGEAIGRYLLGEPVGEGGMGVVYSAYDPQLDRAIAVKLVRIEGADARTRDEARARLLREAQAMARLSHPNVVTVYDAGVWKDRVFLAMELVRGARTAGEWLRDRPRSVREIIRVFVEAGRGIAAAHAAGIVHRDVKPANILVDENGHARITDFGIARADDMTETVELGGIESPNLTAAGRVVGTPAYMAPEVLFGGRGDARSDQFGFCVALHASLYGVRPYPDNRIRESALVDVIAAPAGTKVPLEVRRVLLRGLALRPDDRYPTMNELIADLERTSTRPRTLALASAAAGVAVIAIAFAAVRGGEKGVCGDTAPLRGVWDADTQGAIERAFRANDPAGNEIWGRAKSGLDRTATEWSGALAGACRVPEEGSRLLRVACLEKQRDRLRMLTGVLRSADAEVIAHASIAAATIPRAAECDDVRGISLTSRLPEAPDTRREIAALELRIAEASVQADAGKYAEALASLESTATRAAAIGFRPLEAEALFALGVAQHDAGRTADSTATLSRAVLAAEAAGDDRLAARAAARLANNASLKGDGAGRDAWLARARAILERLGPDDRADADVTLAAAWAAYDDGRREESLALAQRSAALRAKLLGSGHPETLRAGYVVAIALTMLGRFDEAIAKYDETVRQFDASLGLQHPGASAILTSEAFLLMRLGRFAEADAALARAVPLAERFERDTPQRALAYLGLALLRLRQNRLDDALQNILLAEQAARASSGEHSGNYLAAVGVEGEIRLARHDVPGALAVLDRMKGNADAETNAVIAEALLAAGHSQSALQALELASSQLPGETPYPGIAARVRFDLARVLLLTGGDRVRARELALLARRELAPLAWQRDRLDEVDRWLADPRNAPRSR